MQLGAYKKDTQLGAYTKCRQFSQCIYIYKRTSLSGEKLMHDGVEERANVYSRINGHPFYYYNF